MKNYNRSIHIEGIKNSLLNVNVSNSIISGDLLLFCITSNNTMYCNFDKCNINSNGNYLADTQVYAALWTAGTVNITNSTFNVNSLSMGTKVNMYNSVLIISGVAINGNTMNVNHSTIAAKNSISSFTYNSGYFYGKFVSFESNTSSTYSIAGDNISLKECSFSKITGLSNPSDNNFKYHGQITSLKNATSYGIYQVNAAFNSNWSSEAAITGGGTMYEYGVLEYMRTPGNMGNVYYHANDQHLYISKGSTWDRII